MSMFRPFRILPSVALLVATWSLSASANTSIVEFGATGSDSARLATYQNATGETSFALSISPQIDNVEQLASDISIYVDTSASQTGLYRKDTFVMLRRLLANLNSDDRIKLFAVDIEPVELTSGYITPGSDEVKVALAKLRKRVPLGSTDVPRLLEHAGTLENTDAGRNKNAIYIGDGISRGNFLKSRKFPGLIKGLVDNRVAFSSFAIGPERDIEALSAIANQTGGNVYVDTDEIRAINESSKALAQTIHSPVFWPTQFELPEDVAEVYPAAVPPLRTDRDTILIGSLKKRGREINFRIAGEINGQSTTMSWPVKAEAPNVDFAFLPKLISDSRRDQGISLPTLGSDGLREISRVMQSQSSQLAQLGAQAMIRGDRLSAKTLGEAALSADPINSEAEALLNRAKQDDDDPFGFDDEEENDPFGEDDADDQDDPFGAEEDEGEESDPFGEEAPAEEDDSDAATDEGSATKNEGSGMKEDDRPTLPNQVQPGDTLNDPLDGGLRLINPEEPTEGDNIDEFLRDSSDAGGEIIFNEEKLSKMLTQRLQRRVQVEMQRAREEQAANAPNDAVDRLKSMVDVIDQVTNVDPEVRADLRARLVSALMSARRKKIEYDENLARVQENQAIASEIEEARIRYVDREIELAGLINRFETLLNEGQFASAESVTRRARELAPDRSAPTLAAESAGIVSNLEQNLKLRRERQFAFLATLFESEKSGTAFSGDPPLIFPDAAEWEKKLAKREKYLNVRLAGNKSDEAILNALDKRADLEYDEVPFIEVMDLLREEPYNINVVLDQTAK
ncbi:MAG: hypothetical protein AAGA30_12945, partial [Planctomycetota bacterium]